MKRLRSWFDGTTLVATLLAIGVGWVLWQTQLEDRRTDPKELETDTRWSHFVRACWPPDGDVKWGAPTKGRLGWGEDTWRLKSYDWLFRLRQALNPPEPPDEALILFMDEDSHDKLGQSMSEIWDRRLHAQVLRRCLTNGARAVVFDIVFGNLTKCPDPAADQALADAMSLSSNRVVIAESPKSGNWGTGVPDIIPAPDIFRDVLLVSEREDVLDNRYFVGLPTFEPNDDQLIRKHARSYAPNRNSLAWSLAGLLQLPCVTITNQPPRVPQEEERWLNYYGPSKFLRNINYYQALSPVVTNDYGASEYFGTLVSNKIVFIGASTLTRASGERKDSYISPIASTFSSSDKFIAGVEVQATAALNLLHNEWLTRMNLRYELFLVLGIGLFCGLVFPRLGAWLMTAVAILVALVITGLAYELFAKYRVWFGWLIPLTQIFTTWLVSLITNSARLFVQNRIYQNQLGLYLSPKLVKKFAQDKDQRFTKPGAIKHELTVFFSDIAGFTSISEGLDSDELARTMNRYFQDSVGNCIFPTDGTVVKYIGDAIFAFWNAPDPQADHARRACDAALLFRTQQIIEVKGRPLITRIGLHSGVANVGNFGSTQRMDYTAIGENINLASRMEGLNKYVGTETLVTEATYTQVANQYVFRPLGQFILKGFERSFGVYELCGPLERAADFAELHTAFAEALSHFKAGRLEVARTALRAIEARWPKDGPTQLYLRTLEEMGGVLPPGTWSGAIEIKEK